MPTYKLAPLTKTVTEGNTSITFTITRSGDFPAETIYASTLFDSARSPGDYDGLVNFAVQFSSGQTSRTFTVDINEDSIDEPTEHFRVMIARSANDGSAQALAIAEIYIEDDDGPTTYSLTPSSTTKTEGDTTVTFTVTRSGGMPAETIYASTLFDTARSPGDYDGLVNKILVFSEGEETETFTVQINEDSEVEATEHFRVMIARNTGDGSAQALDISEFFIEDDDSVSAPTFSVGNAGTVTEGGNAVFTVTMTGTITAPATVWYSTFAGTASAAEGDYSGAYVNQPLVFQPGGGNTKTISIPILIEPNNPPEAAETFSVGLQGTETGSAFATGTATIAANGSSSTPTFSIGNAGTVTEGSNAVFLVTLAGAITAPVTIWYSTFSGSASAAAGDYSGTFVNHPLTFTPGGANTRTISIPTLVENPNPPENAEMFSVGLQNTETGAAFAIGSATIAANGSTTPPPFTIGNAGTVTEGSNAVFLVTMNGTITSPVTVWYSTLSGTASAASGDYSNTFVDQPLVFSPGGSNTKQVIIPINVENPNHPESAESFSVGLQGTEHGSAFATGSATIAANGSTPTTSDNIANDIGTMSGLEKSTIVWSTIEQNDKDGNATDADYFRIELQGGHRYTFTGDARISNSDTLDQLFIRLRDAEGHLIQGDPSNQGIVTSFYYDSPGTGTQVYYVAVSAGGTGFGEKTGDYSITFVDSGASPILVPATSPTTGWTDIVPFQTYLGSTPINLHLGVPDQAFMKPLFGLPIPESQTPAPRVHLVTEQIPGLTTTVQGMDRAVASLREIFAAVFHDHPSLFGHVNPSTGMYVNRYERPLAGSSSDISNHAWGIAIDLRIDNMPVDFDQDGKLARGLAILIPYFNAAGWASGAGYGVYEDDMHFEVSTNTLLQWFGSTASTQGDQELVLVGSDTQNMLAIAGDPGAGTDIAIGAQGEQVLVTRIPTGEAILHATQFSEISFTGGSANDSLAIGPLAGTHVAMSTVFYDGLGGNDILNAASADRRVVSDGGEGNDFLIGGLGDDIFAGGLGSDVLIGGAGTDTARYYSARAASLILTFGGTVAVFDQAIRERDWMNEVEALQFSDALIQTASLPQFRYLDYVAGYNDLLRSIGTNGQAAFEHFVNYGFFEGRSADAFDGFQYIASHNDLIRAFGASEALAVDHFIRNGFAEGRSRDNFGALQYIATYPDLTRAFGANEQLGALHFINGGFAEGRVRDGFDGLQYIAGYNDLVRLLGANEEAGAGHYLRFGMGEGRARDSFDGMRYVAGYDDLMRSIGSDEHKAAEHYITLGFAEGRSRTAFDGLQYIATYNDLIRTFGANEPLGFQHFVQAGFAEGRTRDGFDALQYVAGYADLARSFGANEQAATLHFITQGFAEGRVRDNFDGLQYIAGYDDLIKVIGSNESAAASHYLRFGLGEGRARDSFDGLQYIASYGDLIRAFGTNEHQAAAHFIAAGFAEGRARDTFDAAQYLANYSDLKAAFGNDQNLATLHFINQGFFEGRVDDVIVA